MIVRVSKATASTPISRRSSGSHRGDVSGSDGRRGLACLFQFLRKHYYGSPEKTGTGQKTRDHRYRLQRGRHSARGAGSAAVGIPGWGSILRYGWRKPEGWGVWGWAEYPRGAGGFSAEV